MPPSQQTTSGTSQAKPYKYARPGVKTALNDANRLYAKGIGGQTYTGSTVIPFSKQTTEGMDALTGMARANMGGFGMSAGLQDILNNGGFTDTQTNTMRGLDQLQNSRVLNDTINGDGLNSYGRNALQNIQRTANQGFDINSNPAFQQVQQNALQKAAQGVNAQAAAAGRYGSGVNQQVLGKSLGDIASNLGYQEYGNWQNRQDTANNNLLAGGNQALGNQMNAIGAKSGLQQALFNAQNAGIGNMSQGYDTMQAPAKTIMGVGSMYEDLAKRQMDDQLRLFDDRQNAPWNQLNRLLATTGQTSAYAPTRTTSTAPAPNSFLTGLSQVSAGAGLLGSLGLF